MLLTIAAITAIGVWVLGLPMPLALLLGGALAPTGPVLILSGTKETLSKRIEAAVLHHDREQYDLVRGGQNRRTRRSLGKRECERDGDACLTPQYALLYWQRTGIRDTCYRACQLARTAAGL